MATSHKIEINKQTKDTLPRVLFGAIKDKILGKGYELSLSFVSPATSRKYNKEYRGKDYPTNILSFPLSKNSGEILIELSCVKRDAPNFDMTYPQFLKFLFIHGCLHLIGMEHSSTMEKAEKKFLKLYK